MNLFRGPLWSIVVLVVCSVAGGLQATEQTLQLNYGWNAVWLEVSPEGSDGTPLKVEEVFQSTFFHVDKVARLNTGAGTAEFVDDPGVTINADDWDVWSRSPESGENAAILARGHSAYKVYVSPLVPDDSLNGTVAGTIVVDGKAEFRPLNWKKGKYNLVGFGVTGEPTFGSLFAASRVVIQPSDPSPAILRLDSASGSWIAVAPTEFVRSGSAYWVKAPFNMVGMEDLGPVSVNFTGEASGFFSFGGAPGHLEVIVPGADPPETLTVDPKELTFSNLENGAGASHVVTLTRVSPSPGEPGASELQVLPVSPIPGEPSWQVVAGDLDAGWQAAELQPKRSQTVSLGAIRNWSTPPGWREHLYRVEASLSGGTVYQYLPVRASNPDVSDDPAPGPGPVVDSSIGLWYGQVVLHEVTSLGEAGRPLQPTTSKATLRVLLHADADGNVSLLSSVLLMQTKVADPTLVPEQVLVLNEALVPQFEGIQERMGKRVGVRLETASFAMPRDLRPASLSGELLASIAAEAGKQTDELSESDVVDYFALSSSESRPPDLPETYRFSWALSGQLAPGGSLSAGSGLTMDPYHHLNPFRHAYHRQLGKGYAITRTIDMVFDAVGQPGLLGGSYQEKTSGLATTEIVSRGRVLLRKVSDVSELQQ